MEIQPEKVYVAVGKDLREGLGTLEWALKKWFSQSITFVILHVSSCSMDFVYTPFGRLPASSVNNEILEVYRMQEKDKTDKLLNKYKALCGKVSQANVEILQVEKFDEPVHKVIVELISSHHVTKLVMGLTFTKSSSRKGKTASSGSSYVHKHKPDFCELFLICGGKLVFLREDNNDERYFENAEGAIVADMRKKMKVKDSIRGWIGRLLPDSTPATHNAPSSETGLSRSALSSSNSPNMRERWEDCVEEIEAYFRWLSALNSTDEELDHSPVDQPRSEVTTPNMSSGEKIESIEAKIEEAHNTTKEKRNEAKVNADRRAKAEWVLSMCNRRANQQEIHWNQEISKHNDLNKSLEKVREELQEVSNDLSESKNRLKSASDLEGELKDRLQAYSFEKWCIEVELEKAAVTRAETLREIEEIRRQRLVLFRRIEFCRERQGMATSSDMGYGYREFTVDDIREATDNFSDRMIMTRNANGMIYRGRLNHTTVAIKMQNSLSLGPQEQFQAKMELLCQVRHPHVISVIGACTEQRCIIVEYMHNGSLKDFLFSNQNPRSPLLPWKARLRITTEVCLGLGFLHSTIPSPKTHGRLKPSNVLLDRNLVAKIADFRLDTCENDDNALQADISALGVLMLQLLTGRPAIRVVEEVVLALERGVLVGVLDEMAGEWPKDVALEFARIGVQCAMVNKRQRVDETIASVIKEMEELYNKVVEGRGGQEVLVEKNGHEVEASVVPSAFLCPILQEVMEHPYIAADGFSYELEAIEEWLWSGHDTSPMTNLKLKHKHLTPNHTLRSLIQDWRNRSSSSNLYK